MEGCPSGQRGRTVNPLANAFVGSNPIPLHFRLGAASIFAEPSAGRLRGSSVAERLSSRRNVGSSILSPRFAYISAPLVSSVGLSPSGIWSISRRLTTNAKKAALYPEADSSVEKRRPRLPGEKQFGQAEFSKLTEHVLPALGNIRASGGLNLSGERCRRAEL